jgi:catechol 2,3-dioxygenase-like lactoylglutathione lyase family enzyme
MFKIAIPVLHVSSSVAAEEFYCGRLGFRRYSVYRPHDTPDPCYMSLVRDGAWLHLSSFRDDGAAGTFVFLVVDDVDALHAEFLAKGIPIDLPPTDQTWGNREMYVRDPDRNKISFVVPGPP